MSDSSFHNPVRGALNAGFLAVLDGTMHRIYGERKTRLLQRRWNQRRISWR